MRWKSRLIKVVKILAVGLAVFSINIVSTMMLSAVYSPPPQSRHLKSVEGRESSHAKQAASRASLMTGSKLTLVKPAIPVKTQVKGKCTDLRCTKLLSDTSFKVYQACESTAFQETHVKDADIPHTCTFRDGRGHDPVGLVSVQGSGNTWVRGLLEKATGICTGAIYCDIPLRNSGFVGESVRDGSVLVVKTHTQNFQWKDAKLEFRSEKDALYDSAIFLIRNPFDAFVAERHRLKILENIQSNNRSDGSHVDKVDRTQFGNNKEWDEFVHRIGEGWRNTVLKWLGSAHRLHKPLLVVRYEDVKRDKVREVSRMLDFLHQDYNRTELAARLEAGFGQFHRPHAAQDNYDHYTARQRTYIRYLIKTTAKKLQSMKVHYEGLKLQSYLY